MRNLNEPPKTEKAGAELFPFPFENRTSQPENPQSLLPSDPAEQLHMRWDAIQTGFIDDPRVAVKDADALVESSMKQISDGFADKREQLKKQWDGGEQASTEDLRLALQQYRTIFSRVTSMLTEWRDFEDRP